jgi:hypothetical protein
MVQNTKEEKAEKKPMTAIKRLKKTPKDMTRLVFLNIVKKLLRV